MKTFRYVAFAALLLNLSVQTTAQLRVTDSLQYGVQKVYPFLSVAKADITQLQNLRGLDTLMQNIRLEYSHDWIKEYVSVEISGWIDGQLRSELNESNDKLSPKQRDLLKNSDHGSEITVVVKYLPKNNLKENQVHELNFSFSFEPESDATFPGGLAKLMDYLREMVIDKLALNTYQGYDLSTIRFTVDADGTVINPHVFGDGYSDRPPPEVQALLLEAIKAMPCWQPAQYADGSLVAQDFAFNVGNMSNCVVNLLNIKREEN